MSVACMPQAPPYILHVRLSSAFTYQTVWLVYRSHGNVTTTQCTLVFSCFPRDKEAYCCWLMPYVLGGNTIPSAVLFSYFQWSSVVMFSAMSASGSGMLFCLFEGSVLSIKRHEPGLGTTSLSPSFLSLIFSASRKWDYSSSHRPLLCWG